SLPIRVGAPGLKNEPLGIVRVVRMRNSGRHLRDRFLTGEAYDGLGIRKTGPAQPEAAGLEAEDIVTGEVGKHGLAPIRLGPFRGPKMTKGGGHPTSPVSSDLELGLFGPLGASIRRVGAMPAGA